jgi:hypothetical protein
MTAGSLYGLSVTCLLVLTAGECSLLRQRIVKNDWRNLVSKINIGKAVVRHVTSFGYVGTIIFF